MYTQRANMLKQFSNYAGVQLKDLLRKSLTSASGVGSALIPQHLEQIITNAVVFLSPEFAMLQPEYDPQKLHEFNRVTALGAAGSAIGEGATTPTKNSTYFRDSVLLKIIRRKGAVTNFLQDASAKYVDAMAVEMENVIRAHVYDLNWYVIYGNEVANQYEFGGWDKWIKTNRFNFHTGGTPTLPTSLTFLDDMIDASNRKGGILHQRAFYMTPEMRSRVSRLLTNVQLQQTSYGPTTGGLGQVEIRGGWRLSTYRDIPILESTYMSGRGAVPMAASSVLTTSVTGGSLSDGVYYIAVQPVTLNGDGIAETVATPEQTITLSGGGSVQVIHVAITPPTSMQALQYKVFASQTTGTETLVDIQPAFTYDSDGTPTGAVSTFEFKSLTPTNAVKETSNTTWDQSADKPNHAVSSVNAETVMLIDLDKYQGMGKLPFTHSTGNRVDGVVSIKPLAETDDFVPFLVKTYGAVCPSFEATSAITMGLLAK